MLHAMRRLPVVLVILVAGGVLLFAWRALVPTVVGGWSVGAAADCDEHSCGGEPGALAALDEDEPGHPAVVATAWHRIDPCPDGLTAMYGGFGPTRVLLVTLADGSKRAIGVGGMGTSRGPHPYGTGPCGQP